MVSELRFDPCLAIAALPSHDQVGWRDGAPVDAASFRARVAAWQALAREQGGRNIALYLEDTLEFAAALLAAWQEGKTVWLCADALPDTRAALAAQVDVFWGAFADGCHAGPAALPPAILAPLAPELAALVVFTSGSTGTPQAIPKRYGQLTAELAALEETFGAQMGQVSVVATVSHQHIYGLLFRVLWPLATGRSIDARSMQYPEQLNAALAQRPCVLVSSPAHLTRLPEHLDWQAAAASVRAIFCSGGPLPAESGDLAAQLLGMRPLEVFGSSETGGIAWRQGGLTWMPLPGVEWSVGQDGNLQVRSPHLADAGWFGMADRASASGAGFQLRGRADRIVKIEEKRISLDAMESALCATGLVAQARIHPSAEAGTRMVLAAFAVLSPEGAALLAAEGKLAINRKLRAALAQSFETVALPRRWRYLDAFPVNAQGKTTQAALLALLDDRPRLPGIRVLEQDAQRVLMELTVPPELVWFDGHFDDFPILPGVVQVDWALQFGRAHFALAPLFRGLHALKFQNMIRPADVIQLELVHDTTKGSLGFRYSSAAGQHSSGRAIFQDPA